MTGSEGPPQYLFSMDYWNAKQTAKRRVVDGSERYSKSSSLEAISRIALRNMTTLCRGARISSAISHQPMMRDDHCQLKNNDNDERYVVLLIAR